MPHAPLDIAVTDYPIAVKPAFGGEMNVLITKELTAEPGGYEIQAANSGTYTSIANEAAILADNPPEMVAVMQARCDGGASNIVLTVVGTDNTDTPVTGTATFQVPGYANITDKIFGKGFAVDVETSGDQLFKTVTSVTSANDADAIGGRFLCSAFRRGPISSRSVALRRRTSPRAVMRQVDRLRHGWHAFTKFGRSRKSSSTSRPRSAPSAMVWPASMRSRCTVLLRESRRDRIVTDNLYLMQAVLSVKPTYPDGEGEATLAATGRANLAMMSAM
jgi:hypothetical protein